MDIELLGDLNRTKNFFYSLNQADRILKGWENINSTTELRHGTTDLQSKYPAIAKEWHPRMNGALSPHDVTYDENLPVWWLCKRGHSWFSTIKSRTNPHSPSSCKYCREIEERLKNKKLLIHTHPHIAKEWDFEKNKKIRIEDIPTDSEKSVYWKCACSHSYKQTIKKKVLAGTGCEQCNSPIIKGVDDLQTTHPHIAREWDTKKNLPLTPLQVRASDSQYVWWKCSKCSTSWKKRIKLKVKHNNRDCPRCDGVGPIKPKLNDLATTHPHIAKEWAETENELFFKSSLHTKTIPSPYTLSCNSRIVVTWICSEGHRWQASPYQRVFEGKKCPVCNPKYLATTGVDDLQTTYPDIAKEWNYERNKFLTPDKIKSKSGRKVWWICKNSHEWQEEVIARVRKKNSECPYCSGKRPIVGETDLATTHKHLLDEWDFEKNKIKPTEVFSSSNKKVYWKCCNNHTWEERVQLRAERGYKCPYCSNKKLIEGENDLQTLYPHLANEWHTTNTIPARKVLPLAKTQGNWKCSNCSHEWTKSIGARINNNKCPKCNNKQAKKQQTDTHTNTSDLVNQKKSEFISLTHWSLTQKELLEEWDYSLNNIQPELLSNGSNKKVWWTCKEHKHSWEASVKTRTKGSQCPYCSHKKLLTGFNDLNTTHAHLMHMWDFKKNTHIDPKAIFAGTKERAWFICTRSGTTWNARICDWASGKQFKHCKTHCGSKSSSCI